MKYLRKLIPKFLQDIDHNILISYPRYWASRFHYHLWFVLILNVLAALIGLALPVRLYEATSPEFVFSILLAADLVYLCFWIYRSVLFNVEKRHGTRGKYQEPFEFLIQVLSVLLICSFSYTIAFTVSTRTDLSISDEEFKLDMLSLSAGAHYFSFECCGAFYLKQDQVDGYSIKENYTTSLEGHQFFHDLNEYLVLDSTSQFRYGDSSPLHKHYIDCRNKEDNFLTRYGGYDPDSSLYYGRKADSIALNFPLYYTEHGEYLYDPELSDDLPTRYELRDDYISTLNAPDSIHLSRITGFIDATKKYTWHPVNIDASSVLKDYKAKRPVAISKNVFTEPMRDINDAKTLDYYYMDELFWLTLFCIAFTIALLLTIFKNIYWQPFLIAVVVGFLIPVVILIGGLILDGLFDIRLDEDAMVWANWTVGLSFILLVFGFNKLIRYRTYATVISILANVIWPIAFLVTLVMLQEYFDIFGIDALSDHIRDKFRGVLGKEHDPVYAEMTAHLERKRELFETVSWYVFWTGLVIYVFVLHPYFRKVYTRLWSLPEKS